MSASEVERKPMLNPFVGQLCASAFSASFAEFCTIPLDTAKVRLQLQASGSAGGGAPKYRGMLGTMRTVAAEEGMAALWKGITPGIHRQVLFGGLRIGMYEPVKNFYVGEDHVGDVPLQLKIAAGLTTGALGIMVASPTDLVKVRMQAEGKLPPGTPKKVPERVERLSHHRQRGRCSCALDWIDAERDEKLYHQCGRVGFVRSVQANFHGSRDEG